MKNTSCLMAGLIGFGLLGALAPCFAQDRTERPKHPVLSHGINPNRAAEYERAVLRVMAMSEAEMLALIPTKSTIVFCGCPNCEGGQQESRQFSWTIERPSELRCRFCDHVYPSAKYPMERTAKGVNALGESVTYRYYFDEKRGRDFWFEAAADRFRRDWFVQQGVALARAYHATHKAEYARRAALVLNKFAEAYPRMAVLAQWPYRRREIANPTPPYPYYGGKWGRWMPEEVPQDLPEAYDLIYSSDELDKLSKQYDTDVRRRIEKDLFRATVEYILTFGSEPTKAHLHNMSPTYVRKLIDIGRIIGEPDYVHWGCRWVDSMLGDRFFYDGMWCEAPSYHYQTIGGIRRVMTALKGYSDPPGYKNKSDGLHLENLNLEARHPFVQKVLRAPDLIAYPDGHICPVHDSWARSRPSPVREETHSTLLPGFGHAALGLGRGKDQVQAHLHFAGGYGHKHADNLNFALFAKGSELLSDIGYTHSKLRHWTISTVGHNTVALNRRNQAMRDCDGDLLLFVPDLKGLAAVEARGERAYPGLAQVYRRQLLLVPISETDSYVVDIFRVQGGSTHDWLLHGSADADMTAECSLPLTPHEGTLLEPGEKWTEPTGENSVFSPYGLIREVRQGSTENAFHTTFRYARVAETGVRTHLIGDANTEVFLGKSPRVRQAEGDDRKVYDYWMPQLVVRRHGAVPLTSAFVAIHEPFRGQPFLQEVRRVPVEPSEGALALTVKHGDWVDTIISTLDDPPSKERRLPDGIVVEGRIVVVREKAGRVAGAWIIDGARVAKGDFTLTLEKPRIAGVVESALRRVDGADMDAFVTSAVLPIGDKLAGQWIIVTHGNGYTHGYEISRVEQRSGKSIIVLRGDPGIVIRGEQTEESYFPRRKITGPNRFVIAGQAASERTE